VQYYTRGQNCNGENMHLTQGNVLTCNVFFFRQAKVYNCTGGGVVCFFGQLRLPLWLPRNNGYCKFHAWGKL